MLLALALAVLAGPPAPPPSPDPARLARIRDAALQSDWAWLRLLELSDVVGPRLSGSPGQAAGEAWLAAAMKAAGARVTLQPVQVPRWERGEERAALVGWAGRPEGVERRLSLTALGGSGATPATGLTAPVLVVRDFDELERRAGEARGAVVVFTARFDQRLAEAGHAGAAYGQAGRYRFTGPSRAAALGAAAALVRSVGGAEYRLPHTGLTTWKDGQAPIPAAALAAEDADLLERLAARGPLRIHLLLTPRTLPDGPGQNVIADLPGREAPEQVVLLSGHLDSWDLGDGAQDDGAPTVAAFAAVELLARLGLQPRRTIRAVAFANEENGSRGAKGYLASVRERIGDQVAALESDAGAAGRHGAGATRRRRALRRRHRRAAGPGRALPLAAGRHPPLLRLPPQRRRHGGQGGPGHPAPPRGAAGGAGLGAGGGGAAAEVAGRGEVKLARSVLRLRLDSSTGQVAGSSLRSGRTGFGGPCRGRGPGRPLLDLPVPFR